MIPTVSPLQHFGALTASSRFIGEGLQHGAGHAIVGVVYRGSSSRSTKRVPTWMTCPTSPFEFGKQLYSTTARAAKLGSKFSSRVGHCGLLIRGGGGGGSTAAAPLAAVLFATACISGVLERRTKAGAVVGAPLLSFGTFCLLR